MRRKRHVLCRHCRRVPASRPRRLCSRCYRRRSVRRRYPRQFVARSVPDGFRQPRLPPFPTFARGGTPEKLAVLCRRAHQGYHLWHPLDGPDLL